MSINDKKIDAEIGTFPYFRPPNQLPFPGTKGCLLVTTSDFTLPPRIDLMKWKTIESLIGVYDIEATLENNILSLYKTVNNERTKVFEIGVITVEDKEKISKLNYVSYIMNYVDDTHTFNFVGVDKDNNQTTIFSKDIVDYQTFTNAILDLQNQINNIKDDITEINDEIIDVNTNLEDLNDFKNQYIAILQILAQATNPNLILSKDGDGVTLKWVNRYGLNDVIAEVNAVTNTITFKKVVNGVENVIITIDNFNYADYLQFKQNFENIQNDLNEASVKDYILAKINNVNYDWIDINNILKFSSELNLIDNKYYQLKFKMFDVDHTINYYDKEQIDNILNNYYTINEIDALLSKKQNELVAGDNITLENLPNNKTKISASGSESKGVIFKQVGETYELNDVIIESPTDKEYEPREVFEPTNPIFSNFSFIDMFGEENCDLFYLNYNPFDPSESYIEFEYYKDDNWLTKRLMMNESSSNSTMIINFMNGSNENIDRLYIDKFTNFYIYDPDREIYGRKDNRLNVLLSELDNKYVATLEFSMIVDLQYKIRNIKVNFKKMILKIYKYGG